MTRRNAKKLPGRARRLAAALLPVLRRIDADPERAGKLRLTQLELRANHRDGIRRERRPWPRVVQRSWRHDADGADPATISRA